MPNTPAPSRDERYLRGAERLAAVDGPAGLTVDAMAQRNGSNRHDWRDHNRSISRAMAARSI